MNYDTLPKPKLIQLADKGHFDHHVKYHPMYNLDINDPDFELKVLYHGSKVGEYVFGTIRFYKDVRWFKVKIMNDLKTMQRPYFLLDNEQYFLDLLVTRESLNTKEDEVYEGR